LPVITLPGHREQAQQRLGNKWSLLAKLVILEGRTDNAIKNRWNTHLLPLLKQRLAQGADLQPTPQAAVVGAPSSVGHFSTIGQREYSPSSRRSRAQSQESSSSAATISKASYSSEHCASVGVPSSPTLTVLQLQHEVAHMDSLQTPVDELVACAAPAIMTEHSTDLPSSSAKIDGDDSLTSAVKLEDEERKGDHCNKEGQANSEACAAMSQGPVATLRPKCESKKDDGGSSGRCALPADCLDTPQCPRNHIRQRNALRILFAADGDRLRASPQSSPKKDIASARAVRSSGHQIGMASRAGNEVVAPVSPRFSTDTSSVVSLARKKLALSTMSLIPGAPIVVQGSSTLQAPSPPAHIHAPIAPMCSPVAPMCSPVGVCGFSGVIPGAPIVVKRHASEGGEGCSDARYFLSFLFKAFLKGCTGSFNCLGAIYTRPRPGLVVNWGHALLMN